MTGSLTVSREDCALVLIDIQERLVGVMRRRDEVVATAVLLARCAAALGIPVLVTRQYPKGLGDTVEGLREATGQADVIDKLSFDCSAEPGFISHLERTGRRQVVLAGMEAHICVAQTALGLLERGYDVQVVADAVCSRRDEDRDVALDRLRAAGVVVTTAESTVYEALGRAGTPEFRTVLEAVKDRDAVCGAG